MVVASSADSASFRDPLVCICSACDFFSASLDAGCWDSDGEVCSVGGGAFGEQPYHSARKDVRCFVAEEEED